MRLFSVVWSRTVPLERDDLSGPFRPEAFCDSVARSVQKVVHLGTLLCAWTWIWVGNRQIWTHFQYCELPRYHRDAADGQRLFGGISWKGNNCAPHKKKITDLKLHC